MIDTYLHVWVIYIFSTQDLSELHCLAIYLLEKVKIAHGDLIISMKNLTAKRTYV